MLTGSTIQRLFVTARTAVILGAAVGFFTMPVLMWQVSGSSAWTAGLAAAQGLPVLFAGPIAGFLVDNLPRFRLAAVSDAVAACCIAALLLLAGVADLTPVVVLVVAVLIQVISAVTTANTQALALEVAGKDNVGKLQGRLHQIYSIGDVGVPLVAGALIVMTGVYPLLSVWAVCLLASAAIMGWLGSNVAAQPDVPARQGILRLVRTYGSLVRRTPAIRRQLVVATTLMFGGGMLIGQMVPWMETILGLRQGDLGYGLIFASWGLGSLVGSTLARRVSGSSRWRPEFVAASSVFVLAVLLASVATAPVIAAVAICAWGASNMVLAIGTLTERQRQTPNEFQGTVAAYGRAVSLGIGWPAGAGLAGLLVHVGVDLQMVIGLFAGVAAVVLAGVSLLWSTSSVTGDDRTHEYS